MMHGYDYGSMNGLDWLGMSALVLVWTGLVVALVVWFVRSVGQPVGRPVSMSAMGAQGRDARIADLEAQVARLREQADSRDLEGTGNDR